MKCTQSEKFRWNDNDDDENDENAQLTLTKIIHVREDARVAMVVKLSSFYETR